MDTNKNQPSANNVKITTVSEELSGALLELDEIMDNLFELARRAGDLAAQIYALKQAIEESGNDVDLGKSH